MKRLLCVLLITVCVFALGSCEILEKFSSFERVEMDAPTNPDPAAPEGEEIKKPDADKVETTTPEKNDGETTPDLGEQQKPDEEKITVEIKFQSGGVHAYQDKITLDAPATFSQAYNQFVAMHEDIKSYRLDCYINDQKIDTTQVIYLNEGDCIYLQESGASLDEEYPCIHVWYDGSCTQCGSVCTHETWADSRQCLVCGAWLGVDLLQIEIHENGEFKYNANGSIETTVEALLMAYYGYYPWDYWTSSYDIYFNDVLITDGSFMITEHGILNLVSRSY